MCPNLAPPSERVVVEDAGEPPNAAVNELIDVESCSGWIVGEAGTNLAAPEAWLRLEDFPSRLPAAGTCPSSLSDEPWDWRRTRGNAGSSRRADPATGWRLRDQRGHERWAWTRRCLTSMFRKRILLRAVSTGAVAAT